MTLAVCAVLACASRPGATPRAVVAAHRPPNVLFVAIDDLRPDLGCLGTTPAVTPRLDGLAASGALFTRHYAAVPTCGASRYALLTGRAPRVSGVRSGNEVFHRGAGSLHAVGPEQGARSLPELFRRNGYRTVLVGKLSHTPDGRVFAYDGSGDGLDELPDAWDELATPMGAWRRGWGAFFAYPGGRHREDGATRATLTDFAAEGDLDLPDGNLAARAAERLTELARADAPFFLAVGFYKPHLPWVAPRGDLEALQAERVSPPCTLEPPASQHARTGGEAARYAGAETLTSQAATLEARRAYLAAVRYVDRQVGRVLDALETSGASENTIVVLWSDHGWHLGEGGLWGKHTPHERALLAPLIVRAPGVTQPGTRVEALVEATDVYPTLIELCGLTQHATRWPLDGASLVPLCDGRATALRDVAVSTWGDLVSVRTATHRLIARETPAGPVEIELFDLSDGPDPTAARRSGDAALLASLLARLREVQCGADTDAVPTNLAAERR